MTERPILFSAPMVRAILHGRKTQTRRVVKGAPHHERDWSALMVHDEACFIEQAHVGTPQEICVFHYGEEGELPSIRCPYGVVGDALWVRESGLEHRRTQLFIHDATPGRWWTPKDGGRYGASYGPAITRQSLLRDHRVRPSIHMPRWACRLTLEIVDVRVERLHDISEADATAEGSQEPSLVPILGAAWSERDAYARLWEHINGSGSWATNPWVWVVTFQRREAGT